MKIIELETAKLAKQKNFVEECQKAYIKRKYADRKWNELVNISEYNINWNNAYSAPYQSELQDWLRNIHDIHMYVNHYQFATKGSDGYFFHIDKSIMNSDTKYYGPYDTYEEALEEGLYQALKLVK